VPPLQGMWLSQIPLPKALPWADLLRPLRGVDSMRRALLPYEPELKPGEEVLSPEPPEGSKAVFNGRDLAGWEGSPAFWSVEDGCLTGKADGTLKFNRFLTWRGGKVKNFELRVKVKVSPTGNSGLQYRGTERPDLGESVVTGYQQDCRGHQPAWKRLRLAI
jgi:Domain of Unknown Function (DUF1080)